MTRCDNSVLLVAVSAYFLLEQREDLACVTLVAIKHISGSISVFPPNSFSLLMSILLKSVSGVVLFVFTEFASTVPVVDMSVMMTSLSLSLDCVVLEELLFCRVIPKVSKLLCIEETSVEKSKSKLRPRPVPDSICSLYWDGCAC